MKYILLMTSLLYADPITDYINNINTSNTDTTTVTSSRSATVTDNRPPDEKGL